MTIAIGQTQQTAVDERGLFDLVDDWLKRDRFVFIGWSPFGSAPKTTMPTAQLNRIATSVG
jgi:hypothetical protein